MATTWKTIADVPVPAPPPATPNMATFMIEYDIYDDIKGAQDYFKGDGSMGADYANPLSYLASKIRYAKGMLDHDYPIALAPADWDYTKAATDACMAAFNILSELPVSAGDPNSLSFFMAWVLGTGSLPGGHPKISVPSSNNPETGQGAAPAGSIL